MTFPSTHLSLVINCSPEAVYSFASLPENLPKWAAGLSSNEIKKVDDFYEADSPMGKVKIKFAPTNVLGVMDHDVTLPSGEINYNPFRVLKSGNGSEVVFTLYRLPRMSESEYHNDIRLVETDLKKLKSILESEESIHDRV